MVRGLCHGGNLPIAGARAAATGCSVDMLLDTFGNGSKFTFISYEGKGYEMEGVYAEADIYDEIDEVSTGYYLTWCNMTFSEELGAAPC